MLQNLSYLCVDLIKSLPAAISPVNWQYVGPAYNCYSYVYNLGRCIGNDSDWREINKIRDFLMILHRPDRGYYSNLR